MQPTTFRRLGRRSFRCLKLLISCLPVHVFVLPEERSLRVTLACSGLFLLSVLHQLFLPGPILARSLQLNQKSKQVAHNCSVKSRFKTVLCAHGPLYSPPGLEPSCS